MNDTATATGSGPLPDAGAQLRACFVHYGPQQTVQKGEGWVLTAKAVVTVLAENTLGELESYEKTLEVNIPLPITPPEGTMLVPECWLSTENVQCTCAGGTLEATITVRAEGPTPTPRSPCASTTRRQGRGCLRWLGGSM